MSARQRHAVQHSNKLPRPKGRGILRFASHSLRSPNLENAASGGEYTRSDLLTIQIILKMKSALSYLA